MRNRIIAYLLIALFVLTIWAHVEIAREHAAAAEAYADAANVHYQVKVLEMRARWHFVEAREMYVAALAVCGKNGSRKSEVGNRDTAWNVRRASR